MTARHKQDSTVGIAFGTPPNSETYVAALERALRETTYALALTGRRQTEIQERLTSIRQVLDRPLPPAEAMLEIRRLLDAPQ